MKSKFTPKWSKEIDPDITNPRVSKLVLFPRVIFYCLNSTFTLNFTTNQDGSRLGAAPETKRAWSSFPFSDTVTTLGLGNAPVFVPQIFLLNSHFKGAFWAFLSAGSITLEELPELKTKKGDKNSLDIPWFNIIYFSAFHVHLFHFSVLATLRSWSFFFEGCSGLYSFTTMWFSSCNPFSLMFCRQMRLQFLNYCYWLAHTVFGALVPSLLLDTKIFCNF